MNYLVILPDCRWAGHCISDKSNKVWAACLAVEQQEDVSGSPLAALPPTTEVLLLCGYGPYGAALRVEPPQRLALQAGSRLLQKKWQEKIRRGYRSVAFEPFVSSFGSPFGLPLRVSEAASNVATDPGLPALLETRTGRTGETPAPWRHTAALVKEVSYERMRALLSAPREGKPSRYAVSEKANGHRCLLDYDGHILRAYNRKGQLTSAPPEGAHAFCRIGHPFVIDGERLIREHAGHFVAFDVLEWEGESVLMLPYRLRMARLVRAMQAAGLLKHDRFTPTLRQAQESSTLSTLSVLLAVQGAEKALRVIEDIRSAGGEGVVIRNLDALYAEGGFKYKFLEDIDVFVIGTVPGVSAGSLTLGLVRPADGAVLEVGHVRSGLNDREVEMVRDLLAQGQFPVFKISYLPASTTGISLVQPQTSMEWLRHDKHARECTTDQLGPHKAFLVALSRPVAGVTMPGQ